MCAGSLEFYDPDRVAIVPMGFCYPGKGTSGDLPPRTETVARWAEYLPDRIVMPHPSPRNRHWLTKNPWFEADAVPALQARVRALLG